MATKFTTPNPPGKARILKIRLDRQRGHSGGTRAGRRATVQALTRWSKRTLRGLLIWLSAIGFIVSRR
jgi:hypothetical protein